MTDTIKENDPLDAIFWSATDYARAIAKVLRGLIKIDGDSVIFTEGITATNKIYCYLLAIKAMQLMGRRDNDEASPNEIARETKIVGNTVRPLLSKLVEQRLVLKVREGLYKANTTTHLHKSALFLGAHYGRWQ